MVQNKPAAHFFAIALLIAVTTMVYSNSFQGQFTLDDFVNILNNKSITSFKPSLEGVVQAAIGGPSGKRWGVASSGTRWLPNLTFAFNYYLHGENTPGYHAVNLVIHLLGAVVLYYLCLITLELPIFSHYYSNKIAIALFASLIWAIHPLQTNGVTYIVQRMTSMASLFYIISICCYVKWRLAKSLGINKHLLFGLTLFCALMAITSKENAYMLPIILLGYELFFISPLNHIKDYKKLALLLAVIIVSIILCALFFQGEQIFSLILKGYQYRNFTMGERLLTESRVIFLYLSLIILPLPSRLNLNHDIVVSQGLLLPPQTLASIIGIGILIALIFFLFNKNRLLAFGLFWFLANLVIESSIIPLELVYEHRLYLPTTFLFLGLTATVINSARNNIWIARTGFIIVISLFSLWSWQRNQVWTDNLALWTDVVAKSPNNDRALNNLGTVYHDLKQYRKAEQLFLRAIRLAPESRQAYVSLGSLYISQNRYQEALQLLQAGLARQEHFAPARIYHYMGVIFSKTGRFQEAITAAQKALQLNPEDLSPLVTLGISYSSIQQYDKADRVFADAERSGMSGTNLYNNWGTVAFKSGQTDRSIELFRKALEFDPDHPESHYNLGLAYAARGMVEKARYEMRLSMELQQKMQLHDQNR